MQGLQIDCRLAGPWCPQASSMHLDSLLAWAAKEVALRRPCAENATYADFIHDLPLDRKEFDGGEWVWKASVLHVVGWQKQERLYFTQKTPVEPMLLGIADGWIEAKGGSKIDTQRNYAKNGQAYITIEHAQGLRAWCVGDPDGVKELLGEITSVGVKRRMGLGALLPYADGSFFQVKPCEQAQTLWMRRASPVQLIQESTPFIGSWRAPYWQDMHQQGWTPSRVNLPADCVATAQTNAEQAATC